MADRLSRETLNSIVERVLAAVPPGTSSREQEDFEEWALESAFDGAWDGCGTVVPENVIPSYDPRYAHFLEGHVTQSRVAELENGAIPSADEARQFREIWLDVMCLDGEADADVIPGYIWHIVEHSDGRTCVAAILAMGYSFTGVEYEWFGHFRNTDDLHAALRRVGHLDVDRARPRTGGEWG